MSLPIPPAGQADELSVVSAGRAQMFRDAIVGLETAGHRYCVMHGYSDYPNHIPADVDIISEAPRDVPRIFAALGVANIIQVLEHEKDAFYYVLHRRMDGSDLFLAVDASSDFRRNGRVFMHGIDVLANTRRFKFFRVPQAHLEFAYCLVKRLGKQKLAPAQASRIQDLYREDGTGCRVWLGRLLHPEDRDLIIRACESGNWDHVLREFSVLRRRMLLRVGFATPGKTSAYWASDAIRRFRRVLHPTGLVVVFIGPDGVGKTTTIAEVEQALAPAFRATERYHLRPRSAERGRESAAHPQPHAQPPRGAPLSVAKIIWWWFDSSLGFVANILPRLVRGTLVLFDRFYGDVLVDPVRYRYGAPMWFARLVLKSALPRRPLVIYLDAPPEVIRARKAEVALEVISQQRRAYRHFVEGLPSGHVVDAARPIHDVVSAATAVILSFMRHRVAERLGLGLRAEPSPARGPASTITTGDAVSARRETLG